MKTGNTRPGGHTAGTVLHASMEPGHEDREYRRGVENGIRKAPCLNGARS